MKVVVNEKLESEEVTAVVVVEISGNPRLNLFDQLAVKFEELVAPVLHCTMFLGSLLFG